MADDPIAQFKDKQRETWSLSNFGEVAVFTTPVAAHLVRFADIRAGQKVLDVATGTGVVAVTAARAGADVTGLDLTPKLLEQAQQNAVVAELKNVAWLEGDAENLPFPNSSFDVVMSQFGHIFAPRPEIALKEMLRVLKPGGRLAFATWPPEQLVGRGLMLTAKYLPPPPGIPSPSAWGDPSRINELFGASVKDAFFERGVMTVPALSPQHYIAWQMARVGPLVRTLEALQSNPEKRDAYLKEYTDLSANYFTDNLMRQEYLLTRATKI